MDSDTEFMKHPEAQRGSAGPWDHQLKGGFALWESPCVWRGESVSEPLSKKLILLVNVFS